MPSLVCRSTVGILALFFTLGLAQPGLKAAESATQATNFSLQDFRGKAHSLADVKDQKVIVLAFLGCECPLAGQYAQTLQKLATKHAADGVTVWGIFSNQQDSLAEVAQFAKTLRIEFPLLKDPGNVIADQFQATRTPEIVVLDGKHVVRYHGRIDDQFTYGKQRPKAEHDYLGDAITAILAGQEPKIKTADPVGCLIGRKLKADESAPVTYTGHVAKILNKNCVHCHRPGEIGPFSMTSYEETVGWAEMIAEVVEDGRMPPWHANPAHGKFRNDTRLSAEDKQTIEDWVSYGAPQGDPKLLPAAPKFVEGWQIGEPDLVIHMADKPFNVPATGEVRYQYFVVDPGFTEDKWVKAAECRPGNRAVVHHIILGLQQGNGRGRQVGDVHSEWLTATAPGARPLVLTDGHAKLIPAGSRLVFQMHYTPNGTPQTDRSSLGLIFIDPSEVKHQVGTDQATNRGLRIPPGDANYQVDAIHAFSRDTNLLAFFPHMHLRGKAFRYTAVYPDGKEEILLDIPRYDFAWQNAYELAEPKLMPQGSRLRCEATFDNSTENLANPDPKSTVRWGDQTWEEMMIGYFDATPAEVKPIKISISRLKEFEALAAKQQAKLTPELRTLAKDALTSDAKLAAFGLELRKVVPQLDRICWTTVEGDKLNIACVAQEEGIRKIVGGSGRKLPASFTTVATYADKTDPIVHEKLAAAKGVDLQFMARTFGSSVHFPRKSDDATGSLNFWSTESAAFPPAAVEVLKEAADLLKK
ncbi:thiol-disulfide oxidoreductase [Anatilimnocola aggregata]|uniref:Thiol-disulfide oxidoreductase n=1 Tax=Anatilimnocola aggregata TaxID=2528021 RepID=A0A517YJ11_9BACT|nr:redoxin domain-containing protein [Anatilimnocola aggregata]QDU30207.1 thiol-disulfide oxidoreductase [Anatilimnocola aggregata]